jgi:hypothetical protein
MRLQSDGAGCTGELAVCQQYGRGAAEVAHVVVEGQHVRVLMRGIGSLQYTLQDDVEEEGPQWVALADALPGEDRYPGGRPPPRGWSAGRRASRRGVGVVGGAVPPPR